MTKPKSGQETPRCLELRRYAIAIGVACCVAQAIIAQVNIGHAQPPITALTHSTDQQWVVAGSQRGLWIARWPGLDSEQSKPLEMDHIHDLSFSPDGSHLLIAGGSPGVAGIVQLRRWPDLELVRSWSEHTDLVYAIAWRSDGKEWVSASWDGYCRVCQIDATVSRVTLKSHSGPVIAAKYLAEGQVASAGVDRTIVVWDSASGQPSQVLRQHTGTVHALAWQSRERTQEGEPLLASASDDKTVRFWQPSIGRMVRFKRFKSTPRSIEWTPDGRWLLVGCDDGTVFQLDPIQLTTQAFPAQNASVMNLIVAKDGEICLSYLSGIQKLDKLK